MVSVRDNPKPRNYLSRREQRRLLFLVLGLGTVLILAVKVRNPAYWTLFTQLDEPANRAAPAASATGARDCFFPGVEAQWLASIKDDTAIRPQELDALFGFGGLLAQSDPSVIRAASLGRVTRIALFEQSAAYRGQLVTVRGTVRRAERKAAPKNAAGITTYYQAWIQPEDSPDWPIVVDCLALPTGFPTGEGFAEPVCVTGFYFKRWPYRSRRGLELAPLVLAQGVDWRPIPAVASGPPSATGLALAAAGAIGFAVLFTIYVYRRTRTRSRREGARKTNIGYGLSEKSP